MSKRHKDESHSIFTTFSTKVQNEKNLTIVKVKSDHGGEFENKDFEKLFEENVISHNYFCPRTPQQNGVKKVESYLTRNCNNHDQ
jgi:hypothetical protein